MKPNTHTQTLQQTIHITYHYAVHFTEHLFACENVLLRDTIAASATQLPARILCIIDSGVQQHHPHLISAIQTCCARQPALIDLVCPPIVIPGGEEAKNDMGSAALVLEAIHHHGLCRHSYIMAIGGGAVLDTVGYAAALAHRGMRLIRVPTTVLAQNDSGVGVKNGINARGQKNFLGTFAPPVAVLNDAHFLTTLSFRDWRSGISEAIKVALLKDAAFFCFIEQHISDLLKRDMPVMRQLIHRCAQLHLEHIASSGDPFEFGSSRPLDFGHWAAHKLEQLSCYRLRHGEAVALGIALDSTYAFLANLLPGQDWRRILVALSALGFALHVPEMSQHLQDFADPRCLFSGLAEFRQHLGGRLSIPLPVRIGQSQEVHEIQTTLMLRSIELLARYQTLFTKEEVQCVGQMVPAL